MSDRLPKIANLYEILVNQPGALTWGPVDKSTMTEHSRLYYEVMVEDCGLQAEIADKRVEGTYLFRILNHPTIKFLHLDPVEQKHMWADEGFHNGLDGNEISDNLLSRAFGINVSTTRVDEKHAIMEVTPAPKAKA